MPLIPPVLLEKMIQFCAAKHSGQILLHVHQGQVCGYAFTETGKISSLLSQKESLPKIPESYDKNIFDNGSFLR